MPEQKLIAGTVTAAENDPGVFHTREAVHDGKLRIREGPDLTFEDFHAGAGDFGGIPPADGMLLTGQYPDVGITASHLINTELRIRYEGEIVHVFGVEAPGFGAGPIAEHVLR